LMADPVYTTDDDRFRLTPPSRNPGPKETDLRSIVFRSSSGASLPRLIYTAQEAAAITSHFAPDHVDRLEGFAATKDRFLAAPLDRYRVIHIASHAMTDTQILGLSALALSAFDRTGKQIDNLVFASDFTTLRLNADLVVLSACDTSLGKDMAGEGLMGLRYIVLARGAGAVVASLWEVLDEPTSELMTAFYRSFLGGHKSVPAALSEAMRTMLSGSNADPNRWGSFTATISAPGELR
jgi:CHAT domain-containing protein